MIRLLYINILVAAIQAMTAYSPFGPIWTNVTITIIVIVGTRIGQLYALRNNQRHADTMSMMGRRCAVCKQHDEMEVTSNDPVVISCKCGTNYTVGDDGLVTRSK